MTKARSSREKHSFIQFYFDDWKSATAGLPRLVRSVLFDICMYNWDKRRPVSPGALTLITSDVPDAAKIIHALVDEGFLHDDNGFVHSPRALREGERAYSAWEAKSRGGKKTKGGDNSPEIEESSQHSYQQSSEDCSTDSDSDSEPDSKEEDSDSEIELEGRSVGPEDMSAVVDSWNTMARRNGLKGVDKMTSERITALTMRLEEHGSRALIEGINLIPAHPFLLGQGERGWKATLDWFLKPDSFPSLIEGKYEPRPGASPKPNVSGAPISAEEAAGFNARLEDMGSGMRWQQDGKEWLLKPRNK